jgi:hypothetical protein
MLEVQLSTQTLQKQIVAFHDNTLVFYFATGNQPYTYHVGHIKSIEIREQGGKANLVVSTGLKDTKEEISQQALPRVRELVAAVQAAMQAFAAQQ